MSTAGHHQSNRIYPHLLMVKTVIQTKIECPLKTIKKANRQRIWTFINYVPIFLMLRHLPKVVQSPWFSRESHNVPAPSLMFFPLGPELQIHHLQQAHFGALLHVFDNILEPRIKWPTNPLAKCRERDCTSQSSSVLKMGYNEIFLGVFFFAVHFFIKRWTPLITMVSLVGEP